MLHRLRVWMYMKIGNRSSNFRNYWYATTGTWLWGLDRFINEHGQPAVGDPGTDDMMTEEEFQSFLKDVFSPPPTREHKMLIATPHGWRTLKSQNLKIASPKPR